MKITPQFLRGLFQYSLIIKELQKTRHGILSNDRFKDVGTVFLKRKIIRIFVVTDS